MYAVHPHVRGEHEQWELFLGSESGFGSWCFNGATAFQQWKPVKVGLAAEYAGVLQWGHCLSAVETPYSRARIPRIGLLQWGHCLSAVETGLGDWTPGEMILLQWGHCLSAVETRLCWPRPSGTTTGFNGATAFQQWKQDTRTSAPTLSAVETRKGNLTAIIFYLLQWGHCLSAVETTFSKTRSLLEAALQWGHCLSAVETTAMRPSGTAGATGFNGATAFQQWKRDTEVGKRGAHERFNGATAFQQWKRVDTSIAVAIAGQLQWGHCLSAVETRNGSPSWFSSVKLQWGHCLSAVETGSADEPARPGRRASMGPLPFSSGNCSRVATPRSSARCFNGATAFQQWKPRRWMVARGRPIRLQWGHCLSAVETAIVTQFGHQP